VSLFDAFATGFAPCVDAQITAEAPARHRAAGTASFDDVTGGTGNRLRLDQICANSCTVYVHSNTFNECAALAEQ